jgi:hypothetical protein
MTWRREDYGYAAATLAAVLFVAYLIAGNFGLVPSPLGLGRTDGLPQAEVAALALANPAGQRGLPVPAVAPPVKHVARSDQSGTLPAAPSVVIDTKSGTQVTLTDKATVVGRTLAPAGVRNVKVSFMPSSGTPTTVLAFGKCTDTSVRACRWDAPVPALVGTYKVTAVVTDKAGRTTKSNSITVTVVNAGNVVSGAGQTVGNTVTGLTKVVGNAPQLLGNIVNNLVGALHL